MSVFLFQYNFNSTQTWMQLQTEKYAWNDKVFFATCQLSNSKRYSIDPPVNKLTGNLANSPKLFYFF